MSLAFFYWYRFNLRYHFGTQAVGGFRSAAYIHFPFKALDYWRHGEAGFAEKVYTIRLLKVPTAIWGYAFTTGVLWYPSAVQYAEYQECIREGCPCIR